MIVKSLKSSKSC